MKKINSVTVKRLYDNDPDTSYMGEYSDKLEEHSIDRKHGEFVSDLQKPAEGCAGCEEATREENCPTQCQEHDYYLPERGREYRYFNPSSNHVPHNPANWSHIQGEERQSLIEHYGSLENADKAYVKQDFKRMEALNDGQWCYIGIRAEASVSMKLGDHWKCDTLTSGGLWGIESDSGEDYFKAVQEEELSELKRILKEYGFSARAIKKAFENVEEEDE